MKTLQPNSKEMLAFLTVNIMRSLTKEQREFLIKDLNDRYSNDRTAEIKMLKQTVKALDKMCLHYRIGKPNMPEWVFDIIKKSKQRYGNDLQKII